MSWNPNYSSALQNPTPLDVVNSGAFGPAVRRAFQNMSKVDVTYRAIPWSGVDLPMVDDLPQSPKDGAEINYLADEANGIVWRFVFRQATNAWHFIGGPPMRAELTNLAVTRASGSYGDPSAGSGPSITVPFAGVYRTMWHFQGNHDTATGFGYMSIKNGAAATADTDGLLGQVSTTSTNWSNERFKNFTVTAANTVLKAEYRNGAGVGTMLLNNAVNADLCSMEVSPIKVTG